MAEQTHYPDWQKLTALSNEARPDEKVGAKFVVVVDGHAEFQKGDIVELVRNDKTIFPYFATIKNNGGYACYWDRLAPLPQSEKQPEEKKMKKLIPFTDEFDWCEEGVLVNFKGIGERYAVRAKGDFVWIVDKGKKLCEIERAWNLSTCDRSDCQKVMHEVYRPLTNREFAEFIQDHKGVVKNAYSFITYYGTVCYDCKNENKPVRSNLLFRFRGSDEWHPVTSELYEIAKGA